MIVEEMPDYLVREKELKKFLTENIQYQQIAKENRIQGKVYVKFVVNEQDMVTNAEIFREVDTYLDKEALRVINIMPRFKPAIQSSRDVKVYYNVLITFQLQN